MNSMPDSKQQEILNSLNKIVHETKQGLTPNDAIVKVASEKGYSIPMLQRICEAFNKSKSIYKLGNTSQEKRADDYQLADADAVIGSIFQRAGQTEVPLQFGDLANIDLKKTAADNMQKTASEQEDRESSPERSVDGLYGDMVKKEAQEKFALEQAEKTVREAYLKTEIVINDAVDCLRTKTDRELKKIAQQMVNKYGVKGNQLMNLCFAKMSKPGMELQKTAHTVIFDPEEPFVSLTKAINNMKEYQTALLHKEAMVKEAVGLSTLLNTLGMGALSKGLVKDMPGTQELLSARKKPGTQELFSPEFLNRLSAFKAKNMLVDLYSEDEFINKHPMNEVTQAYNDIVAFFPGIFDSPKARPILQTLVKKRLAEGSSFDPVEIANIAATYDKITPKAKDLLSEKSLKETAIPKGPDLKGTVEMVGDKGKGIMDLMTGAAGKIYGKAQELADDLQGRVPPKKEEEDKDEDTEETNTQAKNTQAPSKGNVSYDLNTKGKALPEGQKALPEGQRLLT